MNPNKLGLILGAAVVVATIIFIVAFSRWGLPKDPKEFKRMQQMQSAGTP